MKKSILTNVFVIAAICVGFLSSPAFAQSASEKETQAIRAKLVALQEQIGTLKKPSETAIPDLEVYAKAAGWILRHNEFIRKGYAGYTLTALETGLGRAKQLAVGQTPWTTQTGTTMRGYVSRVDGSIQPYALSLPVGYTADSEKVWPLHLKLHGRTGGLNEVYFMHQHDNKPPAAEQNWIQLDVFGRVNNAYRWAGETDVFEALADVRGRYKIDDNRITLWGFSMGGAGAWHLGLHHPSLWSSVGPGAGFVDFYQYQKQKEKRPKHQHHGLHFYDALDYALNAHNVPVITYGGENDPQRQAGMLAVAAAKQLGVEIKELVGPGMGHKFDPDSLRKFMEFHRSHSETGRPSRPGKAEIRFITYTLKYNRCEWLTVEEMGHVYRPVVVASNLLKDGTLKLTTRNATALRIDPAIAKSLSIDGSGLEFDEAQRTANSPQVIVKKNDRWKLLSAEQAEQFDRNPELHKRHNLQGPIDDAFMEPFLCVRGTGKAWSKPQHAWAMWTLDLFAAEFDKWLRGRITIIDDTKLTQAMIDTHHIILFGDPGSNSVLAKVLPQLPITWNESTLAVNGTEYDPNTHGLAMIYPNPLNPRRYVVVNSGHTIHEKDFRNSNSWLFPRLGDIAVQKFKKGQFGGGYEHKTVFADFFNSQWKLPSGLPDVQR